MKVTKWLFLLSLILFPLGEVIRISVVLDVYIKPLDIIVILTTLTFCFHVLIHGNIQKKYLLKPILFFIGSMILSLVVNSTRLNSSEFLVASSYLVRWIGYAGLYFVVSSFDTEFKKKTINYLFWIGFAVLSLGFIQYFLYPDLRNVYYLGWDEHLYRLFSTFLDPNFAAAFLSLFSFFLLSARQKISFLKNSLIFGVILFLTFVGIILTYSRSGVLMLIVGIIVYLILLNKKKLIVGLIVLIILSSIVSSQFRSSEGTNLLRTASVISRFDSYQEAISVIKSSPVFGVGFNAYKYALQRENIEKPTKAIEQHGNTGTDSSLLFVFATTGIMGLISYLYLIKNILVFSLKKYKQGNVLALGVFAGFIGLLINSLFVNSLFYPFIMFWMWINLGLIEKE